MFNRFFRIICVLTLSCMLCSFSACSKEEETGAGFLFTCALPENPACLDPQYTEYDNANIVIANIMEGLMRLDKNGIPVEAGAESYTITDDGLHYMFNLREGCVWYQNGMREGTEIPVTAKDYVYAFRRLLDPVTQSPYAQYFSCIKNANSIMAGTMEPAALGVSAPDDSTVMFQLEYTNAEFLQLLALPCSAPCNEEFFLSTNGRYGLDAETTLCNGPFYITKWNYDAYGSDNFITMRKNKKHYDTDNIFPSSLQFTILKSQAAAERNFADGNADIIITESYPANYLDRKEYSVLSERAQTLGLIFNPENEILQNEDLRLAIAYGIDRASYAAVLGDDMTPAYGVIPPAATLLDSSYREICADEPMALPYDPERAAQLFERAANKLQLNSLNSIRILMPTTITDTDALLTICQEWQTLFGQYIGIEMVTPQEYDRRLASGEYSIALYGVHANRNSCYEVLQVFSKNKNLLGFESQEYNNIMIQLASVSRISDSVSLYNDAERAILDTNTFIPLFYKNIYLVATAGNRDIIFDPFSGIMDFRRAKHFSE
ncbi:MAG: peptide ABC transporter substrate-binding protein [Ruminococcus sp.]|nr:peptide ABC transporter substrate-binding protein [Ruminococcus sp.]